MIPNSAILVQKGYLQKCEDITGYSEGEKQYGAINISVSNAKSGELNLKFQKWQNFPQPDSA